jgi:hypothetical protein
MDTQAKLTFSASDGNVDYAETVSDSTERSNGMYGIGLGWDFGDHFAVRAEWNRYVDVGSEDVTGEGDIETLTGLLIYRF